MRIRYVIPLLYILLAQGCGDVDRGDGPAALPGEIVLGVEAIGKGTHTRAAVDQWNGTTVGIAYAYGSGTYSSSFNVTLTDNSNQMHVNTGIDYPDDGTVVRFAGYHPAAVQDMGVVSYDISKGDVDVMLSNEIQASFPSMNPGNLDYRHKLTRITFRMNCSPGSSYPEPVLGVIVKSVEADKLMGYVRLNLNDQSVNFYYPNSVLAGGGSSHYVPAYGADPLVIDAMVQPGVRLQFSIQTLTGVRNIDFTSANEYWTQLNAGAGGEEGKQYVIDLAFSGVRILDQNITMVDWQAGETVAGSGEIKW